MFRNRKVILPSVAIVFTLIVCSILVNFALANSGTPTTNGNNANSIATTALTGYTNIDLAVMASNDAAKKATGEDKYRILQILPDSMSSYAAADQAMTAKVTATGYAGTIKREAEYNNTSSLWKYVYDGEYFRYAVFNGYKTISANMAEGAVQLTSATVSELNSMDAVAQEILSSADFIYIAAFKATDFGAGGTDLSEDLYNWLDVFATVDRHPLVIDWYALCTNDPDSIKGNNDTYRMGTLAYKLMTVTLISRYNNVLVTEPDFFWDLFQEAEDNKDVPPMVSTTKTISDFILTAETKGEDGGRYYIGNNTYYKWYTDQHSFEDFVNGNVGTYEDSSFVSIGNRTVSSGDQSGQRRAWDFDNAKILIISEGKNSAMFDQFKDMNDSTGGSYELEDGVWQAEKYAENSELTSLLYPRTFGYAFIPSGADIFLLDAQGASGDNFMNAISGAGVPFTAIDPAATGYRDIATTTISGQVTSNEDLIGQTMYLMVRSKDGPFRYVTDESTGNRIVATLEFVNGVNGIFTYKYAFVDDEGNDLLLNADYTYTVVFNDGYMESTVVRDWVFGNNGYDFDIINTTKADAPAQQADYDYDGVNSHWEAYQNDVQNAGGQGVQDYYVGGSIGVAEGYYVCLQEEADVVAYVTSLHEQYRDSLVTDFAAQTPQNINLLDYDVVFIDKGNYSDEIGDQAYNALCAAVEAGVYFIVSSEAGDGIGSGSGDGGSTGGGGIIVNSPSAKAIADIINAGVYRDGADNKFRVLEIQPNYPIDTELAASLPKVTSAWTGHSDGSAITGDYYTVPSDVVEGKPKEELPEKTEYYDFDLTKAKIAYAIDGVDYSDIELTQVSTEALIGMRSNISATYDLVYIGGDFTAMDRNVADMYKSITEIGNSSNGFTYQLLPTFIMYYHTGGLSELSNMGSTYKMDRSVTGSKLFATPYIGSTYYQTTYLAENGNDLTKKKYDELVDYIAAGRPIMVSDELTSVYDKMTYTDATHEELSFIQLMMGYWYNNGTLERKNIYLDPSSRIYTLLGVLKTRATGASGYNVIWGFDASKTQRIDNADRTYGDTLYTYNPNTGRVMLDQDAQSQNWYNSPDTLKKYATVFSEDNSTAIHNLVTGSAQRVRLSLLNKPTKYIQGIEATYLRTPNLSFTFTVDGGQYSTYNYALYVDKDKNTTFDEDNDYYTSGTVKAGEEKTVNMLLDSDFFGAASWYLEITDPAGVVVATQTGVSKIINLTDGKSQINVLQVQTMAEGQGATSWTATDTLYFDIQSQTAHKILKYNSYANQTALDTVSAAQYTPLGRHENRFGIVEYDMGILNDDYLSNLADAITDDYEVNLDMVVASASQARFTTGDNKQDSYDCLDTWVEEAETLAAGGNVDGHNQAWYQAQVNTALMDYSNKAAAVDAPKAALDAYLRGAIQSLQGTYTGPYNYGTRGQYQTFFGGIQQRIPADELIELFNYMMDTGEYYMVFWPMYSTNTDMAFTQGSDNITSSFGQDFIRLFKAYRDAKNAELDARDVYQRYLRRSYGNNFMKRMYSILVLGPSDSFGGFKVDFKPKTCEYILDYVGSGGDLFFFHDTMTPFADAGAVNLTKSLLNIVGMNRFHVDLTDMRNSYDVTNPSHAKGVTSGGVEWGTLTEDGYLYVMGPNNGQTASTPAGYVYSTLQEDEGWIYWPHSDYGHTNDWRGHFPEWDNGHINTTYIDQWGNNTSGDLCKKWATRGEQGWIYQEAKTYEQVEVPTSWGGTEKKYMDKVAGKKGDEGYIYKPGGEPLPSGSTVTDVAFKSSDPDLYYMTPYAFNTAWGPGLINSMNANMADAQPDRISWGGIYGANSKYYISALAMTPLYFNKNNGGATITLPYLYAQESFTQATAWSAAANFDQSSVSQTVKAKQLNEGLVTLYPFSIGSSLNISGTHMQGFALDLETDKVKVWYTLAGSNNSNGPKMRSSLYAASPYDGMESYFIYTTAYKTGTVTYCGAGHSSVTGQTTKNNDERKLFINVIVNSAAAVVPKPNIRVFDPDGTFENEMEKDEEITATTGKTVYKDRVESKTDTPEFDFNVNIPDDIDISMINIYYDLDYDEDFLNTRPTYNADTDVMIKSYTTENELKNVGTRFRDMVRGGTANPNLQLKDEYFTPYGGNYTYIVLEVYYSGSTKPVYVMIKITVSDPLFELTQNDLPVSVDAIAEEKRV